MTKMKGCPFLCFISACIAYLDQGVSWIDQMLVYVFIHDNTKLWYLFQE